MRTSAIAFLLCLCGIACTTRMPNHALTGEDKLPSTFFSIDPHRDTTITTPQGAKLTIPAGALDATGDTARAGGVPGRLRLEVKEAYTMADIIRGGLVTASGKLLLSSGGMIYINVAGAQGVRVRKAIKVAIPTTAMQPGMRVYQGIKDSLGHIDWSNPQPLADTLVQADIAGGKAIFQMNCSPCHALGKVITGPPLAWITTREPDKRWLYDAIRNYNGLLARKDHYAWYLYNLYNKTPMNLFPNLSDADLDRLLLYISHASQSIDSNQVINHRIGFDSARRDQKNIAGWDSAGTRLGYYTGIRSSFYYYTFQMMELGWHNIDCLVRDVGNVEPTTLNISVKGKFGDEAVVLLVIPSIKVLHEVDPFEGKIDLPRGLPAFILCMGEHQGQPFYGQLQWTIRDGEKLKVEPVARSRAQIDSAIGRLHLDSSLIGPIGVADR